VLLLFICLSLGVGYLFYLNPVYCSIGSGGIVLLLFFLNRLHESVLLIRAYEAHGRAYKHIYTKIDSFTEALGLKIRYRLYVRKGGTYAKLYSVFGIKRLIIGLDLITSKLPEEEINFIIAHEFARYKIKRVFLPIYSEVLDDIKRLFVFNFFIYPFERSVVYTADRIASLISGSHEHCVKVIKVDMLGIAFKELHSDDFLVLSEPKFDLVSFLVEFFSRRPNPAKRIAEIIDFYNNFKILYSKRHESDGLTNKEQPITLNI